MSTKTTFKRIALVAVAALGFGVLTSVAPASAAQTAKTTEYVTSIVVTTDFAPVAGATGNTVTHTVAFRSSTTATTVEYNPKVILAEAPATSTLGEGALTNVTTYASTTIAAKTWQFSTDAGATRSAGANAEALGTVAAAVNGTNTYDAQILEVRYDVAGTYKWVFFDDLDASGTVNGPEFSTTTTVVVGGSSATTASTLVATVAAFNGTAAEDGTKGSLVKITLKDAAGNAAGLDSSGGIRVTVNGAAKVSAVNGTEVTDAAAYTLGANDFNGDGNAWVNVTDATAETVALTLSGTGSATGFTSPGSTTLVFKKAAGEATAKTTSAATSTTKTNTATTVRYVTAGATATAALKTGNVSATLLDTVLVTDTSGKVTGCYNSVTACAYDLVVAGDSTADAADPGSFSVSAAFTAASQSFQVTVNGGSAATLTATAATLSTIAVTAPTVSYKSAAGSTQTLTVKATDSFGSGLANVSLTPAISGRNSTLVLSTIVTGSTGTATFTYKDASTSTTSLVDSITFSSSSTTSTAFTVSYTSAANLGVSTLLLTTPSTSATTGATTVPTVYSEINAGDGVEAGAVSVVALVKDASGTPVLGVPVTFTVAGTTAAILSTKVTVYSGSDGKATSSLYAWASGTYTVTATSGTVSDTADSSWIQTDDARAVSLTTKGDGIVVATVKDRLGNPVKGIELTATRVGTGSFGGASSIKGTTAADGTVEFILADGTATVKVAFATEIFQQTDALKGLVSTNAAADVFTAYTAGTATVAEEGVGASFDAAGVNSASIDASGANTSQAAADAAAEATDAANAATDAANAAAEAADAATAAAQDAADAVAALSTQVSEMVNALKKQITALTNLVIKIQKKVRA
jgi:hypothetical protein